MLEFANLFLYISAIILGYLNVAFDRLEGLSFVMLTFIKVNTILAISIVLMVNSDGAYINGFFFTLLAYLTGTAIGVVVKD
ncbi:MAG: hypothetical protein ACE5D7_09965 [Fidelibacterota bacterium]